MTTTRISGDELSWIVECLESQADHLGQWADELARESREAHARGADDAEEYEYRARVKRDEADLTERLRASLAGASAIVIEGENS